MRNRASESDRKKKEIDLRIHLFMCRMRAKTEYKTVNEERMRTKMRMCNTKKNN